MSQDDAERRPVLEYAERSRGPGDGDWPGAGFAWVSPLLLAAYFCGAFGKSPVVLMSLVVMGPCAAALVIARARGDGSRILAATYGLLVHLAMTGFVVYLIFTD